MADVAGTGDRRGQALTPATTIFALSSGSPPAGIAVVRISGPGAGKALTQLTGKALPEPRLATVTTLRADDGEPLDTCLVLWFRGPASATGEDVAELHLHGGRAVVSAVVAALGAIEGLRPAEPGDFTRRAFENGRIDFAQAEALGDLLRAETEAQRRSAMAQLEGGLARLVGEWQTRLVDLSARIEALVDHSDEDDVDEGVLPQLVAEAHIIESAISASIEAPPAERLHDGVRIVVAGRPNAGKSSLINALSGRDAAIVAPLAGTTRDVIEVPLIWGGYPVILIDTAGLRDSDDAVENIGIARARSVTASADLVVALDDSVDPAPHVLVITAKADLGVSGLGELMVSAKTGEGLAALRNVLITRIASLLPSPDSIALNARHRSALRDAAKALAEVSSTSDIIIHAELIRVARQALDRVTGGGDTEAMLDALFGRFCIGK